MRPDRDWGRERGAALLTVLLLVAMISVMAATALERLRLSTRLAANTLATDQARGLAYAAETLATTRVTDLLTRDPSRVTLAGDWSDRPFALPFAGGGATARVNDGGNCFNLNGLVTKADNDTYVANGVAMLQLVRLARLLNVPGGEGIAAAAADWIDSDDVALPGGAEDSSYTGGETPYRTAGTLMADPSELRAVAGVTPEAYAKLRPWLCTLPIAEPAKINVNTLTPEQAPLLAMLLPDSLGIAGARAMLLRRPPAGYASAAVFWQQPALAGATLDPAAQGQAAVMTRWFALRIDVRQGPVELVEYATIDARALPARLVSRQWGDRP